MAPCADRLSTNRTNRNRGQYGNLDEAPTRAELEETIRKLGVSSPRDMMRTTEPLYQELSLADADDERLLSAMTENPILIERPIVIRGDRAIIARPPAKILDLLGDRGR